MLSVIENGSDKANGLGTSCASVLLLGIDVRLHITRKLIFAVKLSKSKKTQNFMEKITEKTPSKKGLQQEKHTEKHCLNTI